MGLLKVIQELLHDLFFFFFPPVVVLFAELYTAMLRGYSTPGSALRDSYGPPGDTLGYLGCWGYNPGWLHARQAPRPLFYFSSPLLQNLIRSFLLLFSYIFSLKYIFNLNIQLNIANSKASSVKTHDIRSSATNGHERIPELVLMSSKFKRNTFLPFSSKCQIFHETIQHLHKSNTSNVLLSHQNTKPLILGM